MNRNVHQLAHLALAVALGAGCGQALAQEATTADTGRVSSGDPSPVARTLDAAEETHLVFMREEEKLARDVYITLGQKFPHLRIFGKIDDSEQRHTCAVCDMLEKYGVEDPNTNDNVGMFTGEDYGPYFTRKYRELVARGSNSAMDALHVGAFIEELDMVDINYCPQEVLQIRDEFDSPEDCGALYTDKEDLKRLYGNLLRGSENHLRAYVRNIEKRQGVGTYQAQVLSQEEVDIILGR